MDAGRRIVLMSNDPPTQSAVAGILKTASQPMTLEMCTGLQALVAQLEKKPASVILVDIDPEQKRTLAGLDSVLSRFPQTRLVVLSHEVNNELMLEAMQVGARHLLPKRSIEADLLGVLGRFVFGESLGPKRRGQLVTVLSAGGGCGATTLSLNLAHEVQLETARPVLLVDLDEHYGSLAAYLNLEGDYGIADVLARKQVDEALLHTTALTFGDRLHVLLSPASTRPSAQRVMDYNSMSVFLDVARKAYGWTVLDAPRLPAEPLARIVGASTTTFLVLQLSVKDIRTARSLLKSLTDHGVSPESVTLVLSRYHRRSMISLSQAREALGRESLVVVGSDFRHALESMTYGQPLAEVAPRSPLRKEIRDMALGLPEMPAVSV
jgi:pilus assembly protein CpaE